MAAVRTREMQLRSIEEDNRQGLNQVRPLRLVTVYCLVIGEASPFLAVKVNVARKCYQTAWSASCHSAHTNCDVLTKDIKRPEETREENTTGRRILNSPTTQAENP
jgi:hypothetical protein